MFNYINNFFSDPKGMLIFLLLAMPGRLLALSAHEFAHAWMANRAGDSTARLLGRMTINPIKHIDPIGFILMMVAGFGWAKPVPVNPLNYQKYRRDDLRVSMAGIAMNLMLFVSGLIVMYA
ncbi:MAG: site-2 protease family protein, partial [Lentisphaerae bacterium]|nr:site-2 protease family protein [Lentisphaerota bacterium]